MQYVFCRILFSVLYDFIRCLWYGPVEIINYSLASKAVKYSQYDVPLCLVWDRLSFLNHQLTDSSYSRQMFKLDIQGFKGLCIKLWSCARCMDFISSSAHLGAICCISSMASSFKRIRIIAIGLFILIIKRIIAFICGNFVQMYVYVCAVYWNERHPFFFFLFCP